MATEGGTVGSWINGDYLANTVLTLSATPDAYNNGPYRYKFHQWTSSNGGSFANISRKYIAFAFCCKYRLLLPAYTEAFGGNTVGLPGDHPAGSLLKAAPRFF